MSRLFLLFNHTLTPDQQEDARTHLGVEAIIVPPADISRLWSQLPPDDKSIAPLLAPVRDWLDVVAVPGDHVLIHGDFGACFLMAGHAMSRGLIPIYSTTERHAIEEVLDDGSVHMAHRFRHVLYRRYGE